MDVVAKRFNLEVTCGTCGHAGVIDAAQSLRWYMCHGWDLELRKVGRHLWCMRCRGGRPGRIYLTGKQPNAPSRFPKDEAGWLRLVKSLR
jgi:hypothetical protein